MKRALGKLAAYLHIHITGVKPPKGFISTLGTLVSLLILGTIFYAKEEGWSYFDSFYFTVVTITTVGYGDLHPTTVASKAFTIFLLFMGIGLGLYVITSFAESFIKGREKRIERLETILGKNPSDK
jgi:voltage-gated potassium channel Kch